MKKTTDSHFILDFQKNDYPYFEEINDGILNQVAPIGNGAPILDVGAGRGGLGGALQALGYKVCAIESNEHAAQEAGLRVDKVLYLDIENMDEIQKQLGNKKFKYIIFSDVLEHFFDPLQILKSYLPLLEDEGKLLISLPNAVNWLNRLRFMLGMFNYELTGVMDRTHIRFFTFKSAKKLIEASDCIVERVDSTPFITRAFLPIIKTILNKDNNNNAKSIMESPYYKLYKKYVYPLEYWMSRMLPSLLAFRIILVARKTSKK